MAIMRIRSIVQSLVARPQILKPTSKYSQVISQIVAYVSLLVANVSQLVKRVKVSTPNQNRYLFQTSTSKLKHRPKCVDFRSQRVFPLYRCNDFLRLYRILILFQQTEG